MLKGNHLVIIPYHHQPEYLYFQIVPSGKTITLDLSFHFIPKFNLNF